jgi:hypothetical protein
MNILFIASVSLISSAGTQTRDLLIKTCGLPLEPSQPDPDYVYSERIGGSKHFGVWPLSQAAEACFGQSHWPKEHAVPQLSLELEVESPAAVAAAESELRAQGHTLLHATRTEPWGQTVCRLLTAEGAILGISFAPWLHPAQPA